MTGRSTARPSSAAVPAWRGVLKACRLRPAPSSQPLPAIIFQGRACRQPFWTRCWNRYASVIGAWFSLSAQQGLPALPADPVRFACWLASAGERDRGYSQTKIRCTAIAAFSELANLPSPDKHPLVLTYRKLALRTKTFRRGRTRPVLRGHIPALGPGGELASPPRGTPAPRRGGRAGPSPGTRGRRRAATAAHMAVLHDGVLRYDDAREGQLGDVSFYPDAVEIGVFGSKTDPLLEGQSAQMPPAEGPPPRPGIGCTGPPGCHPGRAQPARGPPRVGLSPNRSATGGFLPRRQR